MSRGATADSKLLARESVLATYPLFMLLVAAERGIPAGKILEGSGVTEEQLRKPNARVTMPQLGVITLNLVMDTRDPGIGLELGLRGSCTKLGLMGFGLMSCSNLREATELGCRYLPTVVSFFNAHFSVQGDTAVVEVTESVPLGPMRQFAFDQYLVEAFETYKWLGDPALVASLKDMVELWFDYPEPEYFARFRDRLPKARFDAPSCQIRYPAHLLEIPVRTANPLTAQTVIDHCETELAKLGFTESLLDRVRAFLICRNGRYPDLETVAVRLHMSERTFKRKLAQYGVGFAELLDEVRKRDSIRLLDDPARPIEEVALAVGYMDPSNFARAFRKWTGETPSAYRERLASGIR